MQVPDEALPELAKHLHTIAALPHACSDEHLNAQISDLFRGCWFRLDRSGPLVLTRKGTRPGDPLADLLFGFLFSAFLRSAENALASQGLETFVPQAAGPLPLGHGVNEIGCMAWVDDFAHLQSAKTSTILYDRVIKATGLLATHASAHGMQLTFAVDKSAVLLCSACSREPQGVLRRDADQQLGLYIQDDITKASHFLPVVDSYRHLGTIAVSNATPGPEIAFRYAKAQASLVPLRRKLFSNPVIPLGTRRTLLRALILSKFVFSSCAVMLQAAIHRRSWCRAYIHLWRALCRWNKVENAPHSYEVLHVAAATSPLLALAQARAAYMARVMRHGPEALLHLLQVHWIESSATSWLGQFLLDVKVVSSLVPSAALVTQDKAAVPCLLESLQSDSTWWIGTIKKAIRVFAQDIDKWVQKRTTDAALAQPTHVDAVQVDAATAETQLPFVCEQCHARFRLRKHLAAHAARTHGVTSPTRHYVSLPYCVACHKWYHSLTRVQFHLKRSHECLLRAAHVIPPLSVAQVHECEAEEKHRLKLVRRGNWEAFQAAPPPLLFYFPRLPTYSEVFADGTDEDVSLSLLGHKFRPDSATLAWVQSWIQGASREGPRADAGEFWLQRPMPDG